MLTYSKKLVFALFIVLTVAAVGIAGGASADLSTSNLTKTHAESRLYGLQACESCHGKLAKVSGEGGWYDGHRRHFLSVFLNFASNYVSTGNNATVGSYGCAKCHQETNLSQNYEGDLSVTTQTVRNVARKQVNPSVCRECHGRFRTTKHRFNGIENDYITQGRNCVSCHNNDGPGLAPEIAHGSLPLESTSNVDPFEAGVWWVDQRYANAKDYCTRCHGGLVWFDVEETNPGLSCQYDLCHGTSTLTQNTGVHQAHFNNTKGPGIISCAVCHGVGADKGEHASHRNDVKNFADGATKDLTDTVVCDGCHSPGGGYNGVNSAGSSVGAKSNWTTGVYDSPTALKPGKEKWCVGCHDSSPPTINGQPAPEVGGNAASYGYFVSGHGLGSSSNYDKDAISDGSGNSGANANCAACHNFSIQHLNGIADWTFAGQRISSTINGTATSSLSSVCLACHQRTGGPSSAVNQVSTHGNAPGGTYVGVEQQFSIECAVCHEVHGNNNQPGGRNLKMVRANLNSTSVVFRNTSGPDSFDENSGDPSDADDVCVTCHRTATNNPGYPMANHQGGVHLDAGDQRGNKCTVCHSHDYKSDGYVAANDGFMPSGCNACHSFPPGTDQGTYKGSPTHSVHVTTYGYACATCHFAYPAQHNESGVTSKDDWAANFDPANLDIIFKSDINPDGTATVVGSAPNRNRQCQDLYCHGQKGYLQSPIITTDSPEAKNVTKFGGTNVTSNTPTWDYPYASDANRKYPATKSTGACGTCHDVVKDNSDNTATTWPTWDAAGKTNDWSPQTQGKSSVETTVWDVTPNSSIGTIFNQEFGWNAYETHMDSARGPKITCYPCHPIPPTAGAAATDTIVHVNKFLEFKASGGDTTALAGSDICGDICHSSDGEFNGSEDPTIGAKANWPAGVLNESVNPPLLKAGLENWCLGCHDSAQKKLPGIDHEPPNIAGDNSAYGFNVSGHGRSPSSKYDKNQIGDGAGNAGAGKQCLVCHDDRKNHLDGIDGTKTAQLRIRDRVNDTTVTNDVFSVCKSCHQKITGSEASTVQVSTHGNDTTGGYVPDEAPFYFECQVCHEPHGRNRNSTGTRNLKMVRSILNGTEVVFKSTTGTDSFDENSGDPTDADDICVTCHRTSTNNPGYPMTNHQGGSGHTSVGDQRGLNCTKCHSHDYKSDGQVASNDGFMPSCDACHTIPAGGSQGTYQGSKAHNTHVGTYGFDCGTCHNDFPNGHNESGVSSSADWAANFDPAKVDVDFDPLKNPVGETTVAISGLNRNRQCQNLYCHGQAGSINGKSFGLLGGTNQAGNKPTWDDDNNPDAAGRHTITKETGACGTCHDTTKDNQTQGGGLWATWDATGAANDWSATQAIAYDVTSGSSIGTASVAHQTHLDKLRGPKVVCKSCHATPPTVTGAESTVTPSKHVNLTLDFNDSTTALSGTTACSACHSPGGAYDGVNDVAFGAKSNWAAGVYDTTTTTNTLDSGKDKWCVGCHDNSPANINGVAAPDIAATYYSSGHGRKNLVKCLNCHDYSEDHVDGNRRTYSFQASSQTAEVFQKGYRLAKIGADYPLVVPLRSSVASAVRYKLCWKCHNENNIYGSETSKTTNFRISAPFEEWAGNRAGVGSAENAHYRMSYPGQPGGDSLNWNSDWDDATDDGGPGEYGFDSYVSCVTCHNVHGSSFEAMIGDGRLSGKDASATGYDGFEFTFLTLDSTVVGFPPFTDPVLTWAKTAGATRANSLGGAMRFVGLKSDQRACATNGCHGSVESQVAGDRFIANLTSGITPPTFGLTSTSTLNLLDYYRPVVPVAVSALIASDNTITVVFSEPISAVAADFTSIQGSSGPIAKNGQFAGSGTSKVEIGIIATSDATGTLNIGSGVTSVANGTAMTPVTGQNIWNGR